MISFVCRALAALLCAMATPRPPIPDLPPIQPGDELLNRPLARHYIGVLDLDEDVLLDSTFAAPSDPNHPAWSAPIRRMQPWPPPSTVRPCWACGDRAGFHTEHLPCSNVPPFKLTSPTLPDGSQYRRTT